MATNKSPWARNLNGADKPFRLLIPVEAGSSYTFKRGEICQVGKNTAGYAGPVTAATDVTALLIADEEQTSDDVARNCFFIVPLPGDLFEFDLAAARACAPGECFAISDSQTLAFVADASTNVIARCASTHNAPLPEEKSVTKRSVDQVLVLIDEQASYFVEMSGNS